MADSGMNVQGHGAAAPVNGKSVEQPTNKVDEATINVEFSKPDVQQQGSKGTEVEQGTEGTQAERNARANANKQAVTEMNAMKEASQAGAIIAQAGAFLTPGAVMGQTGIVLAMSAETLVKILSDSQNKPVDKDSIEKAGKLIGFAAEKLAEMVNNAGIGRPLPDLIDLLSKDVEKQVKEDGAGVAMAKAIMDTVSEVIKGVVPGATVGAMVGASVAQASKIVGDGVAKAEKPESEMPKPDKNFNVDKFLRETAKGLVDIVTLGGYSRLDKMTPEEVKAAVKVLSVVLPAILPMPKTPEPNNHLPDQGDKNI